MNPELAIIKLLLQKQQFNLYSNSIDVEYLKKNNQELFKLFNTISLFHQEYPEKNLESVSDLEVYFHTLYPALNNKDRELYEALFQNLDECIVNPDLTVGLIKASKERQEGHRLALLGLAVAEGRTSLAEAQDAFKSALVEHTKLGIDPFVSTSLREVYQKRVAEVGLRWRLNSMNQMLGSLRKGDYGFIFARPETGKTTFLASEATFMAEQAELPVLWFNNEQEGHVVMSYCYRAALGVTSEQLYKDIDGNQSKFEQRIGQRIRIYDSASIHRKDVEAYCRQFGASLIIFDQIDKIKGFASDRNDLELGAIYQWARELAKEYAPVIGVCQAGESGANKRWLTMEDVVNAKTSKQAEADWILGIGSLNQEGYEKVRHLHLCKNKLSGDADSNPELRHGKRDVLIHPEVARYGDIN